jgi:hypothetical protein
MDTCDTLARSRVSAQEFDGYLETRPLPAPVVRSPTNQKQEVSMKQQRIKERSPRAKPASSRSRRDSAEMYGELCNWFWYHDHPDYPRDGLMHTSDVCRRKAAEIFDLLEIDDLLDEAEQRR